MRNRTRKLFAAAVFGAALPLVSLAFSSLAAAEDCKTIQDAAKRLECFDKGNIQIESPSKDATTKDIVAASPSSSPQTIDAGDLFVAPRKYLGKRIELKRVQCFYADKDEYRCIAVHDALVMVTAANVTPPQAKEALERDCGQIKKVETAACRRTIRFTPTLVDHDDAVAFAKRTVVLAPEIEIPTDGTAGKRR